MAVVLFGLASAVAAVASFLIFTTAKSAIHEILGVALGLVSAIFGVGSVVTYRLTRLPEDIAKALAAHEARAATPPPRDDEMPIREAREPKLLRSVAAVVLLLFIGGAAIYVWYQWPR
jgi:TRAP-type C4-dicarboxylate transport system permease small subunit